MKKIRVFALFVCATFCLNACACGARPPRRINWDWKPNPYVGDPRTMTIVPAEGEPVRCEEIKFKKYTCFSEEDMATLKYNIEKVKRSKGY